MDFGAILNAAASSIKEDSNEATSSLDISDIANALNGILGGESVVDNVKKAMRDENLSQTVTTWVKEGDNAQLTKSQMVAFLGEGKVEEFASKLGIDAEGAGGSLAAVVPMIIDQMTSRDKSIADDILNQVGGFQGIIAMIMRFFRR